jgi:hypothetical protein
MALHGDDLITMIRTATLLDSTSLSDTQITSWLNEGYNRICTRQDWPWLEATTTYTCTPGVASVALTSITAGLRKITALYDIGNKVRLLPAAATSLLDLTGPSYLTDVSSTITEPITNSGDLSMTVASGTLLTALAGHSPSAGNPIYVRFTLDGEIVKITALATNVATIERGCFSTTATTHLDNAVIKYVPMSEAGRPVCFTVWAESMYLNPVPDDDYILLVAYQKAPTAIVSSGSPTAPEFDEQFHEALVHYGEFRTWQREEDLDKANTAYSHFMDTVNQMARWYRMRTDEEPWKLGSGRVTGRATNTEFLNG